MPGSRVAGWKRKGGGSESMGRSVRTEHSGEQSTLENRALWRTEHSGEQITLPPSSPTIMFSCFFLVRPISLLSYFGHTPITRSYWESYQILGNPRKPTETPHKIILPHPLYPTHFWRLLTLFFRFCFLFLLYDVPYILPTVHIPSILDIQSFWIQSLWK